MINWIRAIDSLNKSIGHSFSWCVLVLTASTCFEVFMRYVLSAPTAWAFDMSYMLYGALFMMSGAYALSRNSHVRGDFIWCSTSSFSSLAFLPWSTPVRNTLSSQPAFWRRA